MSFSLWIDPDRTGGKTGNSCEPQRERNADGSSYWSKLTYRSSLASSALTTSELLTVPLFDNRDSTHVAISSYRNLGPCAQTVNDWRVPRVTGVT